MGIFNSDLHLDPHMAFMNDPVFGPNNQWELDPENNNCTQGYKKFVFASCKNTCPGVNFQVVTGGFALLAASNIALNVGGGVLGIGSITSVVPALAGLGLV